MHAKDLVEPFPVVGLADDALAAAPLMAERGLPGLVVVDERGRPVAVLPGSQVLRFLMPAYLFDDDRLAGVLDSDTADRICVELVRRRVEEVLADYRGVLPVVDPDATGMEVAVLMAREHSPLVAVVEAGQLLGVVTVARLLAAMLDAASGTDGSG